MNDLRTRLDTLTAGQRAELARRLSIGGGASQQLVAYALSANGVASDALREHVRGRLPEYMVPAVVVVLDALPRLPNGKVNRAALPEPSPQNITATDSATVSDSTNDPMADALLKIWRDVLGMDQIGVDDDFFELGGDSILSIQIIARAARAGISIKPRQLFEHSTISALVRLLTATAPSSMPAPAKPAESGSRAPVLPIHQWLLGQPLKNPEHWNQAMLLRAASRLDARALAAALRDLVQAHGALRTRFVRASDGAWQQELASTPPEVVVDVQNVGGLTDQARAEQVERVANRMHRGMSLDGPRLMQVAQFDAAAQSDVLIVLHHLAVDVVSWPVLLEELQNAYRRHVGGPTDAPSIPAARHDHPVNWSRRLAAHANSDGVRAEAAYWLAERSSLAVPLPVDLPAGTNRVRDARAVHTQLTEDQTRALLDLARTLKLQVQDALHIAFACCISQWQRAPHVLFDTEGHGREALWDDFDVSGAIGWFTTVFPVRLRVPEGSDDQVVVNSLTQQLRQLPGRGIGHGLLQHYSTGAALRSALLALPQAQMLFAYLGHAQEKQDSGSLLTPVDARLGDARAPDDPRRYVFDVNTRIQGGRLEVTWTYSGALHRHETVQSLADDFLARVRQLGTHAAGPASVPGDFELLALDSADMDQLARLLDE